MAGLDKPRFLEKVLEFIFLGFKGFRGF